MANNVTFEADKVEMAHNTMFEADKVDNEEEDKVDKANTLSLYGALMTTWSKRTRPAQSDGTTAGTVFWAGGAGVGGRGEGCSGKGGGRFVDARWVSAPEFTQNGFAVNAHMLTDHFPDRIIATLEKAIAQRNE
jgi:hypothetical protein